MYASAFLFEKFRLVFSNTNKLFNCVLDPKIHSHTMYQIDILCLALGNRLFENKYSVS